MANNNVTRVRRSIRELEKMYKDGNKEPLEKLMLAWKGIKELHPDNINSMFNIGGYHGEPFRGQGATDGDYWGGYCNHGNVLFPTWHRAYLFNIENALRSIPGCEDVTLPYWDETEEQSINGGVPFSLTDETVKITGLGEIPNPLRSYQYQKRINDNVGGDDSIYTKPEGTHTVRYPYSGLFGTPAAEKASKIHNDKITPRNGTLILNSNVSGWMRATITLPAIAERLKLGGVARLFELCLNAPNYTVFSNTTSAAHYNTTTPDQVIVPLESPHNDVHLAVGGFDVPAFTLNDYSPYKGANGDMGENDTAGFDPIFFFHHCNVDRMFWVWQKKMGQRDALEIIDKYPGTISGDKANPPSYPYGMNVKLDKNSKLDPFINPKTNDTYIFSDVVNIEEQMGYTYSIGSLDKENWGTSNLAAEQPLTTKKLHVSNINRGNIFGSFLITAYANYEGKEYYIGHHSVLSRWNVLGCSNCRAHINAEAHFNLGDLANKLKLEDFRIEITGRDQFQSQLAETLSATPIQVNII
ncbi:tyrosinase family protein [Chitinophaga sp. Cy-1792]|uniref:tyrosinase family protein n=1 Tax=Chitinophaga sp. Cy-1792 TaxID=2608339 RepID=UPI0014231E71|nr:tyrosinase family protein [Chitinophaga sp. Cy-1792]NIG56414.1 tyrosinase family protein [Chitinophaga sp. Cy-1792]